LGGEEKVSDGGLEHELFPPSRCRRQPRIERRLVELAK